MNMKKLLGVFALISVLPVAHARYGQGGWLFGGIGAGGVYVNSSEESAINVGFTESKKLGYTIHLKVVSVGM